MLLQEVLQRLCEGEFSDVNYGYIVDDGPLSEHHGKLVRHIDMALLELHKRFSLRLKEIDILQFEGITTYELSTKYAVSNDLSLVTNKYVLDSYDTPFITKEFLKVDSIRDDMHNPIPLNNAEKHGSMFSTTFNTLRVTRPKDGCKFTVSYRAALANLSAQLPASEVEVELPYSHLEALLFYVASRATAATSPEISNNYIMKFEASCAMLSRLNLNIEDNTDATRFQNNGWI